MVIDLGITIGTSLVEKDVGTGLSTGIQTSVAYKWKDIEQEPFIFRKTPWDDRIKSEDVKLKEIQGNTGVVNQLVQNGDFADGTTGWAASQSTISVSDNIMTVIANSDNRGVLQYMSIIEHKYLLYLKANCPNNNDAVLTYMGSNTIASFSMTQGWNVASTIFTGISSAYLWLRVSHANQPYQFAMVKLCDLTLMYGAGNEPSTVAEFEARIWRDYGKTLDEYIEYTQGKLINCKAQTLESTGQNLWDEEWENGGINSTTGVNTSDANRIRSKNFIAILPNATYYCKAPQVAVNVIVYDAAKNYLGYFASRGNNTFTPSDYAGAAYIRFNIGSSVTPVTTYNHDICINISDAAINGTYRPYKKDVVNFDITTLTGINPTTGVREVMFPNGMGGGEGWRSALRVVNGATVAVKNGERIDMSTLPINSGSVSNAYPFGYFSTLFPDKKGGVTNIISPKYLTTGTFKKDKNIFCSTTNSTGYIIDSSFVAPTPDPTTTQTYTFDVQGLKNSLQGHYVEYQLATPIIYTDLQYADGTPFNLPKLFKEFKGGTERLLPDNSEGIDTISMPITISYKWKE